MNLNISNHLYPRYIKEYKNIVIPREKFIKKVLLYANPTANPKTIYVAVIPEQQHSSLPLETDTKKKGKLHSHQYVKLKSSKIHIDPYSDGAIKMRILFDGIAKKK